MITKIALKNFMSHVDTVLDLGPGLTVVTGPNNCGKSAVVAALQVVCRNHLGEVVVRHGAKECAVTVWTDDPHEITWRRKGKEVSYTIDGTDYSRLKGKTPEVLHDLLLLPEIEEGDDTFDLHFALQKEPIFLLDQAGSKAAKFFASSSDAARLMAMQTLHKNRTSDRKRELRILKEQETKLLAQIDHLQTLDGWRTELDRVNHDHQDLAGAIQRESALSEESQRLLNQHCEVEVHSQRLAILNSLPPVPELAPTDVLEEWLQEAEHATDQIEYQRARVQACQGLVSPPVLPDESRLATCVRQMVLTEVQASSLARVMKLFQQFDGPPKLVEDVALAAAVSRLDSGHGQIAEAQQSLNEAHDAEGKAQRQLKRWMKQHPKCPVCRRPWEDADALALGEHAHG